MIRPRLPIVMILAAMALAGCERSNSPSSSPLSPSPLPALSGPPGATINGVVNLEGASAAGMTVSVAGTSIVAPVDSSGRFSLTAVPSGDIELRFNGGSIDTSLAIAGITDQDQIQLTVTLDSASTVTSHQLTNSDRIEVKGVVASLGGACPDLAFTVNGFQALTNASTRFEDAPCSGVQTGTRVEVKGTRQTNGSILARKVDVDGGAGPDPGSEVKLDGTVSALGGACPDRTFTVLGALVMINSATRFEDGTCGTLQDGTRVQVKGTRQANGSVLATYVDIDDSEPEVKLKGTVAGLGSACPGLTFTVAGSLVVTNGATRYEDGSCGSIQNGRRVEVKGPRQPNGSGLATRVDLDN